LNAYEAESNSPLGCNNFCKAKGATPKGKSTYYPRIVVFVEKWVISTSTLGVR